MTPNRNAFIILEKYHLIGKSFLEHNDLCKKSNQVSGKDDRCLHVVLPVATYLPTPDKLVAARTTSAIFTEYVGHGSDAFTHRSNRPWPGAPRNSFV